MLIVYGSMLCPDCVKCREELDQAGVEYAYRDFSEDLKNLKAFLAIREESPVFEPVRRERMIGIPCIVREDGSITLDWKEFM